MSQQGITDPNTDHTAKAHDYILFKSLLDSLTDLAQFRLIGIISNRKRLVEDLIGKAATPEHTRQLAYRTHRQSHNKRQPHTHA